MGSRAGASWLACVVLAIAACATLTALAGEAGAAPPEPAADRFYSQPSKKRLKKARPGKVFRARRVDLSASNIEVDHRAWQLLYRTTNTRRRHVAAVATLILPTGPYTGRRPLLSYQPAEDSLTRRCASSYELRTGSGGEPELFSMGLDRGWAVVVPDFEGPRSQWTAHVQEGRAVLDAVRAARRFRGAGLAGRRTPVGLWGYSGGGHATAWASELQPRYAPGIRLRGVAHGGAASDVTATARANDGGPASGLILAAAVGISRAHPEMGMKRLLNAAGRAMVKDIGDMCLEEFVAAYPLRRLNEFTVVADPLTVPSVRRVLRRNVLGRRRPRAPLYVYHAILDEVNAISMSDAMVGRYCSVGATVRYVRSPLGEHIAVQEAGAPGAVDFLAGRFAGAPAPNDC